MRAYRAAGNAIIELNGLAANPNQDPADAIDALIWAKTVNPYEYADAAEFAIEALENLEGAQAKDSLDFGPCWEGLIFAAIIWASISARLPAAASLLLAEKLGAPAQELHSAKLALADEHKARLMVATAKETLERLKPKGY